MTIDEKTTRKPGIIVTGIAAIVALTICAGTAQKANAEQYMYRGTDENGKPIASFGQTPTHRGGQYTTGNSETRQKGVPSPANKVGNNYYQIRGVPIEEDNNYTTTKAPPQDDYSTKMRELDEAIRQNPNQASLYIEKALEQEKSSKKVAIQTLEYVSRKIEEGKIKTSNENIEKIFVMLAVNYRNLSDYQNTIKIYYKLNDLFPNKGYDTVAENISKRKN